jgi:phosphohistidine phosphatase
VKRLTLIRHAKSSWRDASLEDFDRPLSSRGRRDAPRMAERLAAAKPAPEQMLASPALRAADTARAMAAALGRPETWIRWMRSLYMGSPGRLLSAVQELDDAVEHAALVGHNPGLSELVELLTDAGIDDVPTCGIVTIELDVEHWRDAAPGRGRVVAFDHPKRSR